MRLSRRQFVRSATGALVFSSTLAVLKRAGIAAEEPIHLGNILDKTGGLNIYSLKQIAAVAMAVDEINAAGGLLGRPVKLYFYDSQSNNQFNSQYATQALAQDQVKVIHGGITSSSRPTIPITTGCSPDICVESARRPESTAITLFGTAPSRTAS